MFLSDSANDADNQSMAGLDKISSLFCNVMDQACITITALLSALTWVKLIYCDAGSVVENGPLNKLIDKHHCHYSVNKSVLKYI